jgi:hypothetical protein
MAATDRDRFLRLVAITTFRASTFLLAIILTLHVRDGLVTTFRGLDTLVGFALFAAFWVATCIASMQGERYAQHSIGDGPVEHLVAATIVAGAFNGLYVFAMTMIVVVSHTTGYANVLGALLSFVGVSVIGSPLAFAVGGVVGGAYGVIEGALFAVSARIASFAAAPAIPHSADVHQPSALSPEP